MGLFSRKAKRDDATATTSIITNGQTCTSPTPDSSLNPSMLSSKHGSFRSPAPSSLASPISSVASIEDSSDYLTKGDIPQPPSPQHSPLAYLQDLSSVRTQSRNFYRQFVQSNQLRHFHVDISKTQETADYIVSIIKRDHGKDLSKIPSYSCWSNFNIGGRPRIDQLVASWSSPSANPPVDQHEQTRRIIDLFFITTLLDCNAGAQWQYKSIETGRIYRRSHGIAIACLELFKAGSFSSNASNPYQVSAEGVRRLAGDGQTTLFKECFQITSSNMMTGIEQRLNTLSALADTLLKHPSIYGPSGRPGQILDYLYAHPSTQNMATAQMTVPALWDAISKTMPSMFDTSKGSSLGGISLGDAYRDKQLLSQSVGLNKDTEDSWQSILPFHHSAQALCYSTMAAIQKYLPVRFVGAHLLTAPTNQHHGGLLLDTGLMTLKSEDMSRGIRAYREHAVARGQSGVEVVPLFPIDDDVVVEWRAATIAIMDDLLVEVNKLLGPSAKLSLGQMLEAGTSKGAMELAEVSRPNTKEAPIIIASPDVIS